MSHIAAITRQGQFTIPKKVREELGITGAIQARVEVVDGRMVVELQKDFLTLAGSLKTDIRLSDAQLREARDAFSQEWARPV